MIIVNQTLILTQLNIIGLVHNQERIQGGGGLKSPEMKSNKLYKKIIKFSEKFLFQGQPPSK